MILIKKFGINTKIKLFLFLQSTWFIIYNSFTLVMGSGTKKNEVFIGYDNPKSIFQEMKQSKQF